MFEMYDLCFITGNKRYQAAVL